MSQKPIILKHNISCNMDMINEFTDGVSGLFMNAQDILSDGEGILKSIEGIVCSIPEEARYAGLLDCVHACCSKIKMCDMSATGFGIIGKTNSYVDNLYSIDNQYAEKLGESRWNKTKEILNHVEAQKMFLEKGKLCTHRGCKCNLDVEKEDAKAIKTLQRLNDAYAHVQDQSARDYYQKRLNEYFNEKIQPILSQRINDANDVTCGYYLSGEKTLNSISHAWNNVLYITKYCTNIATYRHTYENLNNNIKNIQSQMLDTINSQNVVNFSKEIAKKNREYLFYPIMQGSKLDNALKELQRMNTLNEEENEEINKCIREVISFEMNACLQNILDDLKTNFKESDNEEKDIVDIAIVKLITKECRSYAEFNDIYMDVPDRIFKLLEQSDSYDMNTQKEIEHINLYLSLPILDNKGRIIEKNGLRKCSPFVKEWNTERIYAASMLTRKMILAGYEKEFICGMVGNIVCEGGDFGKFEDMHFVKETPNAYQKHMNNVHNYDAIYSATTLSEIGIDAFGKLLDSGGDCTEDHKFGIGCVQWTEHERCQSLYDLYVSKYGQSYYPNYRECAEVELEYLIYEIEGKYSDIYNKWKNDQVKDNTYYATEIIMTEYEGINTGDIERRSEYADDWEKIFGADK